MTITSNFPSAAMRPCFNGYPIQGNFQSSLVPVNFTIKTEKLSLIAIRFADKGNFLHLQSDVLEFVLSEIVICNAQSLNYAIAFVKRTKKFSLLR